MGIDAPLAPKRLRAAMLTHLVAQGAAIGTWEDAISTIRSHPTVDIQAARNGVVAVALGRIRAIIVDMQRASATTKIPFPDPCGVVLRRQPGEEVRRGDRLATIRVASGDMRAVEPLAATITAVVPTSGR